MQSIKIPEFDQEPTTSQILNRLIQRSTHFDIIELPSIEDKVTRIERLADMSLINGYPATLLFSVEHIYDKPAAAWSRYGFVPLSIIAEYALNYQGYKVGLDSSFYTDLDDLISSQIKMVCDIDEDEQLPYELLKDYAGVITDACFVCRSLIDIFNGAGIPTLEKCSIYGVADVTGSNILLRIRDDLC